MKNKKFIVITSINHPTLAIEEFAKWDGWTTIVVGDRKSPNHWSCGDVIYLSLEEQIKQFPDFSKYLPENTYVRKMIGYLYAFANGAEAIFESDDDNIPYPGAVEQIERDLRGSKVYGPIVSSSSGWANIYKEFGAPHCWPRGYPLTCIQNTNTVTDVVDDGKPQLPWGVMQYLADDDPDVDAIYRMTHSEPIHFARNRRYRLGEGVFCPFNSQATLWLPETFPLMFLPLGKTDRVTDILRGYISLSSLWMGGSTLAYSSPVVYQSRNFHNLQKDFEQELDLYKYADEWSKKFIKISDQEFDAGYKGLLKILIEEYKLPEINILAYDCFMSYIKG
jgi:hypothetical protein